MNWAAMPFEVVTSTHHVLSIGEPVPVEIWERDLACGLASVKHPGRLSTVNIREQHGPAQQMGHLGQALHEHSGSGT